MLMVKQQKQQHVEHEEQVQVLGLAVKKNNEAKKKNVLLCFNFFLHFVIV